MPIVQRGVNTWRITISNGFDDNGDRIRITRTVHAVNKTEAEKIEKIMAAEVSKKKNLNPSKMTLKSFYEYWVANYAKPRLADKTIHSYDDQFRRINLALGHKAIDKIEPKHLLSFFRNLRECPRLDGKPGNLSNNSIRKHYILLHLLFKKAVQWQFIFSNPATAIDPPKFRYENKKVILDQGEVGRFLILLNQEDIKQRVWALMCISLGLRRGEVFAIQWKHVDFQGGTIKIEQSVQYIPRKGVSIKDTKNIFSRRLVSIPKSLLEILSVYKSIKENERKRLANKWVGAKKIQDDFIFTTWNGRLAHPDSMNTWLGKFVKKHDLPQITPHSFRHMTATYLINAGTDLTTVAGKLGHANSTTTQVVYAHLLQKSENETANLMEDILSNSINMAKNEK